MALRINGSDGVREQFTSTGTTITLAGAVANFRAVSSIPSIVNGDTIIGAAKKGAEFVAGIFTWNSATGALTQTTIFWSSNGGEGGSAVSFSSGPGEFYCAAPSRLFESLNLIETTVTSAATFDIGVIQAKLIRASGTTGPVTSLGGTGTSAGTKERLVRWSGATVNHNATSLILIGGVNWGTADGDISYFTRDASGNWREVFRRYADGHLVSFGTFVANGLMDLSAATAGQIKFPATQNPSADANTFDDYKEFTWTPVDSSGAALSFTAVSAEGTKKGREVSVSAALTYPATANGSVAVVGGLPFNVGNRQGARTGNLSYHNGATATRFTLDANAASGSFATNAGSAVTNAQMTGTLVYLNATYNV
jgi:hypothetical protein